MEKDIEKTIVVFRKFKDGEIIALFPDIPETYPGDCQSYLHVGQHGAANYAYLVRYITTPATPEEYADLQEELTSIGYNLDIKKRITRGGR